MKNLIVLLLSFSIIFSSCEKNTKTYFKISEEQFKSYVIGTWLIESIEKDNISVIDSYEDYYLIISDSSSTTTNMKFTFQTSWKSEAFPANGFLLFSKSFLEIDESETAYFLRSDSIQLNMDDYKDNYNEGDFLSFSFQIPVEDSLAIKVAQEWKTKGRKINFK